MAVFWAEATDVNRRYPAPINNYLVYLKGHGDIRRVSPTADLPP